MYNNINNCVLFIILFIPVFSAVIVRESGKLVGVVVVFRHGDRNPLDTYPNDPYKDPSYWPEGFGQLINRGKLRLFQLGQWFRKRYDNFLPAAYNPKDIYVRATDVDRVLMSAESNLAGLYPPTVNQTWNPNIKWQPIPVHTVPAVDDHVLATSKYCPRYAMLLQALTTSPEFIKLAQGHQSLFSYLTKNTGKTVNTLIKLATLYGNFEAEREKNLTLPKWTKSVYPDKMRTLAELFFAIPCYTSSMARLCIGPLLNEIFQHFTKITKNVKDTHKLKMFAGHDVTVANVLQALNLFDYNCPPYAATVIFELRSIANKFFVNILYKNSSTPVKMVLKGCNFDCPFEKVIKIVTPIAVPVCEWQQECLLR